MLVLFLSRCRDYKMHILCFFKLTILIRYVAIEPVEVRFVFSCCKPLMTHYLDALELDSSAFHELQPRWVLEGRTPAKKTSSYRPIIEGQLKYCSLYVVVRTLLTCMIKQDSISSVNLPGRYGLFTHFNALKSC
jgi:hypothetical protein